MCSETLGLHSQEQKQTQAKLESYIMQYTLDSHSEKTSEERRNLLKCCLPLLKQATWWHQWRRLPLKYNPVGKPNFFFFLEQSKVYYRVLQGDVLLMPWKAHDLSSQEGFSKAFLKARLLGAGVGWQGVRWAGVRFSDWADGKVTGDVTGSRAHKISP